MLFGPRCVTIVFSEPHSEPLENSSKRRMGTDGLQNWVVIRAHCRPGALAGRIFKQAPNDAASAARRARRETARWRVNRPRPGPPGGVVGT